MWDSWAPLELGVFRPQDNLILTQENHIEQIAIRLQKLMNDSWYIKTAKSFNPHHPQRFSSNQKNKYKIDHQTIRHPITIIHPK